MHSTLKLLLLVTIAAAALIAPSAAVGDHSHLSGKSICIDPGRGERVPH